MDGTKENINKETEDLNNTVDQVDITDMYRSLHPTSSRNMLLKHTWNILHNRPCIKAKSKS